MKAKTSSANWAISAAGTPSSTRIRDWARQEIRAPIRYADWRASIERPSRASPGPARRRPPSRLLRGAGVARPALGEADEAGDAHLDGALDRLAAGTAQRGVLGDAGDECLDCVLGERRQLHPGADRRCSAKAPLASHCSRRTTIRRSPRSTVSNLLRGAGTFKAMVSILRERATDLLGLMATPGPPQRLPRPVRPAALGHRPPRPDRRGPPGDTRRRHPRHPPRPRLEGSCARPVRAHRRRRRRCPPVARLLGDLARRPCGRVLLDHRQGDPGRQGQHPPRPPRPARAPSSSSTRRAASSSCSPRRRPRRSSSPPAAASLP